MKLPKVVEYLQKYWTAFSLSFQNSFIHFWCLCEWCCFFNQTVKEIGKFKRHEECSVKGFMEVSVPSWIIDYQERDKWWRKQVRQYFSCKYAISLFDANFFTSFLLSWILQSIFSDISQIQGSVYWIFVRFLVGISGRRLLWYV